MSKPLTLLKRMPVTALVGLLLTFSFLIMAIFAPWLAPYSMSESVGDMWMGPSAEFLLGTDNLGRDLLSRLIYGARTTITIAALATALAFSIGSVLGILAAVYGGWIDQLISRGVDIVMSIPTLIFALVILSVMPSTLLMLILIMGVLDSTRVFRISRAVAVNINVMDYVEAARLRGEGKRWIIFREILPNALTPLVAELGLRFIFAVLFLSSLSFLGLGYSLRKPTGAVWCAKTVRASCSASPPP